MSTTVDPAALNAVPDYVWVPVRATPLSVPRPWVVARRTTGGDIELHRSVFRKSNPLRARAVIRFKDYDNAMARAGALTLASIR
jgi:hypothetical protein